MLFVRNLLLKTHSTTKLFFNQYPYKLVCRLDLAIEFRGNRMAYVRKTLDNLQRQYDNNEELTITNFSIRRVSVQSFKDGQLIYNTLYNQSNYRLRVQFKELTIYSLEKNWLDKLSREVSTPMEWWEPNGDLPKIEPGTVYLKNDNGHNLRVTVKGSISEDAANWLLNNLDKVKIGPSFLYDLENGYRYMDNMYFYIKNERCLSLLQLVMSSNIRRVDKVVAMNKNA